MLCILAWASALLVSTIRAMPEPLYVGRVTRQKLPRFFVYMPNIHQYKRLSGELAGKWDLIEQWL